MPPLEHEEGVELFLARARAVQPSFVADSAVPEICRRLDELPLALELAAARMRAISPERSARAPRAPTRPARDRRRQRRTRAAADAARDDRVVLRAARRRGARALRTARRVRAAAAPSRRRRRSSTQTSTRCNRSSIRASFRSRAGDRFWMLETIREYAAERLEEATGAEALKWRHADYFLALAEETEPNLIGIGSRREWLDPLERDHDNLRSAMDWFEASGDSDRVVRFAAALWRFWDQNGHLVEGRRRVEDALRSDERPTPARAKALGGAADMALTSGDIPAGGRWAREALELYQELGDAWGAAFSRLMVAYATGQEGDWPRAQELFGRSVRQFREVGDQHYALRAARAHAWAYYEGGDLDRARALYEELNREAKEAHDPLPEGIALSVLADIALDQGRFEEAVPLAKDCYGIFRDLDNLSPDRNRRLSLRTHARTLGPARDRRPGSLLFRGTASRDRRHASPRRQDQRQDTRCRPSPA